MTTTAMKLALGRSLLAAVCLSVDASDALACICVGSPVPPSVGELRQQVAKDLNDALAVFIGEPIARNTLTLRLRVQSVWKGELGDEVVMSTGAEATSDGLISQSSCDVDFALGQVYLIFGHGKTLETMRAHACSFTGPVNSRWVGLLDDLVQRRLPSSDVSAKRLVAVLGSVRNPGLVEWHEGLTVTEAVKLAGGAIPPVHREFAQLRRTSQITRWQMTRQVLPAGPAAVLLPDDEVFVTADLLERRQ